jgi:hypothetical protein
MHPNDETECNSSSSYYIKVIRRVCGPRKEEVQEKGENFIMNSFIICILSLNTIRAITLKRMRWLGHAAYMGEMENDYNIQVRKT